MCVWKNDKGEIEYNSGYYPSYISGHTITFVGSIDQERSAIKQILTYLSVCPGVCVVVVVWSPLTGHTHTHVYSGTIKYIFAGLLVE